MFVFVKCQALLCSPGGKAANYNKSKACHIIAKCGRIQIVQFTFDTLHSTLLNFASVGHPRNDSIVISRRRGEVQRKVFDGILLVFTLRPNLSEKQVFEMVFA